MLLSGGPGQAGDPADRRASPSWSSRCARPTTSSPSTSAARATPARSSATSRASSECAERLGARRAFLNTPETARDLEDLRVALGVDKLTLFGVSYGAKVAAEYARRYPAADGGASSSTRRRRSTGSTASASCARSARPRVLREVCFPGLCQPHGDRRRRGARRGRRAAAAAPCAARSCSSSGRVRTRARRPSPSSYSAARRQRPRARAAGRAAGRDRLARRRRRRAAAAPRRGAVGGERRRGRDQRRAAARHDLHRGAGCRGRRTPRSRRAPAALRAFAAERAAAFAPFRAATRARRLEPPSCARLAADAAARAGRLRTARTCPVLSSSGREDLRTPLEDARRTARAVPERASVLAVPGVGHSVLRTDPTGCARAGLRRVPARPDRRAVLAARSRVARPAAAPYAPATIGALRADAALRAARPHAERGHRHAHRDRVRRRARTGARRSGSRACAPATCAARGPRSSCTTSSGSAACACPGGSTRAAAARSPSAARRRRRAR